MRHPGSVSPLSSTDFVDALAEKNRHGSLEKVPAGVACHDIAVVGLPAHIFRLIDR